MNLKLHCIRLLTFSAVVSLLIACQGGAGGIEENASDEPSENISAKNDMCKDVSEELSLCADYTENLLNTINNHKYLTAEYGKINVAPYRSDVATDNFIEVYVNKESVEDFSAVDPDLTQSGVEVAPGTTIIREVWLPQEHSIKQFTAMVKMERGYFPEGGDFAYAVIDLNGNVLRGGKLEDCAVCHEARQFDGYLFGVPELEKVAPVDEGGPGSVASINAKYTAMAKNILQTQAYLDESQFQQVNNQQYPSALNQANHLDVFVSNPGVISYQAVDPRDSAGPSVRIPEETVIVRQVIDPETLRTKSYTVMVQGPMGYFPEGGDFYYAVFDFAGNLQSDNGLPLEGKIETCGACHHSSRRNTGYVFGIPDEYRKTDFSL